MQHLSELVETLGQVSGQLVRISSSSLAITALILLVPLIVDLLAAFS